MPANLFTLTKAGDLIKNKAIANAVNIKRNGKAIAWLYQNTGNILDYKDGDKVKFDLTAIQNDPDWPILRQDYKDFILSNADTVFTLEFEPRFFAKTILLPA